MNVLWIGLLTLAVGADDVPATTSSSAQLLEIARERVDANEQRIAAIDKMGKISGRGAELGIERAKSDVTALEAAVEGAEASLDESRKNLERTTALLERGAIGEHSADGIRGAFRRDRFELDRRRAELEQATLRIEQAELAAERSRLEFVVRRSEARIQLLDAREELVRAETMRARVERFQRENERRRVRDSASAED